MQSRLQSKAVGREFRSEGVTAKVPLDSTERSRLRAGRSAGALMGLLRRARGAGDVLLHSGQSCRLGLGRLLLEAQAT